MNKINISFFAFVTGLLLLQTTALAQCTEAKDTEMAKYMEKTKTGDAQACSQCGMLTLYYCSAKYCATVEDKRKVGALISEVKNDIRVMGLPGCCPEYIVKGGSKEFPEWGLMVGGGNTNQSSGSVNAPQGSGHYGEYNNGTYIVEGSPSGNTANPLQSNSNTYNSGDADVDAVVNGSVDLLNQLSGGGGGLATPYGGVSSYNSGDADVDAVVNGTVDLLNQLSGGGGSYIGDSYAGGAAVADVLDLFGSAFNDNGEQNRLNALAEEKRRQDAARLQEQVRAQEQAYALENKRIYEQKQRMAAERKALITKYPDGKMPLSYPDISESEIYFFVYKSFEPAASTSPTNFTGLPIPLSALKKGYYYLIEAPAGRYYVMVTNYSNGMLTGEFRVVGDLSNTWYSRGGWADPKILNEVTEQEAKGTKAALTAVIAGLPEISISNVFSVSRFSDNSWPFKSQVIEKLGMKGSAADITLSGYYTSRTDAEASQRYLLSKARECAFTVSSINCSAIESAKIVTPVTDFWGNPNDKTNNASVTTTPVKETISNKPKLDFWGNPIKD